ncbi:MAG: hypothetical protein RBR35_12660 [Salinivirgaceae bacterium]|nr:hypothetical protein [Salinivirgaceae bacterium]
MKTIDTLMIGDVGRTDFFPDLAEEVAGALYNSIFDKFRAPDIKPQEALF